ncbi:MAG: fatty acid hydroxylase [Bacteroidia bacterium]|jgi:hypothetical protein|nr:fatty acid hydroxylase [Bacteroidia bacterium]
MPKNFVSNTDETVNMFKNPILEKFSRIHWSVPLYIFVPVIIFFMYRSFWVYHLTGLTVAGLFVAGIFAWTLAEYILHRYLFHAHLPGKAGARLSFMMHGVHHDYPKDSKRLVMVPVISIPLALFFYLLYRYSFGSALAAPLFSGMVAGYLFYDMTHYAIHHYNTKNRYWHMLKQHHALHHYSESNRGFGVSSKLWDYIFFSNFRNTKNEDAENEIAKL